MDSERGSKYQFFSFQTSERLASEYDRCSGQIDLRTGEILASITYGLFQHRECYRLHVDDPISQFPCTTEDQIISAARHAAEKEDI